MEKTKQSKQTKVPQTKSAEAKTKGASKAKASVSPSLDDFELDLTLLDRLLDDNNTESIILFGEDDKAVEFEKIDMVTYKENLYVLLRPIEADDDEAVVFRIDTEDEDSIIIVGDELAEEILEFYNNQDSK